MIFSITRTVFLVITLYFGATGVYLNIVSSSDWWDPLGYYTIQSNIICLFACIFYICNLFSKKKVSDKIMGIIQGGVVLCIMLTFLVYHFLLAPSNFSFSSLATSNQYVHYFLPLMMFTDYLVFAKKGTIRFKSIFLWTIVPIVYCIFVFIYSAFGGRFGAENDIVPYFFLDYSLHGILYVVKWVGILTVGYLSLSAIFVCIDKFIAFVCGKIGNQL